MHHGVMKGALLALLLTLAPAAARAAQSQANRADPSLAGQETDDERAAPAPRLPLALEPNPTAPATEDDGESILVGAVRVEGATALAPSAFAPAIEPYLG